MLEEREVMCIQYRNKMNKGMENGIKDLTKSPRNASCPISSIDMREELTRMNTYETSRGTFKIHRPMPNK